MTIICQEVHVLGFLAMWGVGEGVVGSCIISAICIFGRGGGHGCITASFTLLHLFSKPWKIIMFLKHQPSLSNVLYQTLPEK